MAKNAPRCTCDIEITRLRAEVERLRAALKPFADAVYNDNGDMTITHAEHGCYVNAYFAMRSTFKQNKRPTQPVNDPELHELAPVWKERSLKC
jgi:hypothetical protein